MQGTQPLLAHCKVSSLNHTIPSEGGLFALLQLELIGEDDDGERFIALLIDENIRFGNFRGKPLKRSARNK